MSRTTTTTKIDAQTYIYLSETRDSAGLLLAEGRWTITLDSATKRILEAVFFDGTTSMVANIQQAHEQISDMLELDGMVCDIQGRVFDKDQRDFVMSRMHYGSPDYIVKDDASNKVWMDCYLLADGFGDLGSYREAERVGFDWSHVRDSSPYAIGRIAEKLRYTNGI
jgi:hypothetical protein